MSRRSRRKRRQGKNAFLAREKRNAEYKRRRLLQENGLVIDVGALDDGPPHDDVVKIQCP